MKISNYIAIVMLLVLASCGAESDSKIEPCEADSVTVVDEESETMENGDSIRFECDSLFSAELSTNLKTMSDDQRVKLLSESKFWLADTLNRQQYIVLFNYLLDHQNEEYDAQIEDFIFEHFQRKSNFVIFDSYYKQYTDPCILEALTFDIITAWKNENESITEKAFKNKFRYLYNNGCLKYYRMLESLEK